MSTAQRPASSTTFTRLLQLGSGGMGEVHLALARRQREFQRLVVLKTIRDPNRNTRESQSMLAEEARICSRLSHPNVVQVTEVVEVDDGIMLVMEYLDGLCLGDAYREAGDAFTLPLRLRTISEALAGLHYAHELRDFNGRPFSIVHRDVSPQNLFLTFDGRVKLLDFGIAKANGSENATRAGIVKGRISYMSAEHMRGESLDRRTDIFAMGCLLFEALTDRRLWKGYSQGEVAAALSAGQVPRLSEATNVDPRLRTIVERSMAHRREDRYETAEQMRLDIEAYLENGDHGCQVLARDVGEMLSRTCEERRLRRQQDVAEAVRMIERGRSEAPTPLVPASESAISVAIPKAGLVPTDLEDFDLDGSGPRSQTGERTSTGMRRKAAQAASTQDTTSTSRSLRRPASRSPWIAVLVALGALLLVGASFFFFAARESNHQVIFVAEPADARVYLDGALLGNGQVETSVAEGSTHVLRVERDGFRPVEKSFSSEKSGTRFSVNLSPLEERPSPDEPTALEEPALPGGQRRGATTGATTGKKDSPDDDDEASAKDGKKAATGSPKRPTSRSFKYVPRTSPKAPASAPSAAAKDNCDPPYFYQGGIKTYKPECI